MRVEQETNQKLPVPGESECILRAGTAGFCMGVALALKKLDKGLDQSMGLTTYTYGPIIHNPQVLAHYASRGVHQARFIEDLEHPAQVVIRAHGIPRQVEEALSQFGGRIIDATCPKVKRAQTLIAQQVLAGRTLLLLGERDHPEVQGLLSYAGEESLVFDNLEKLRGLSLPPERQFFLAAQTTQDRKEFAAVTTYLQQRLGAGIPILDTICDATSQRQKEAQELAAVVDFMVVVGGMQSGNTRRLAQVIRDFGTPCIHIEDEKGLPAGEIRNAPTIGITAGASTPKSLIDRVENTIRTIKRAEEI